jgi:hypothetical protein
MEKPRDQHVSNRMVRLTVPLHELLKRAAAKSQRTLTRELRVALVDHCRRAGLEIPPELDVPT